MNSGPDNFSKSRDHRHRLGSWIVSEVQYFQMPSLLKWFNEVNDFVHPDIRYTEMRESSSCLISYELIWVEWGMKWGFGSGSGIRLVGKGGGLVDGVSAKFIFRWVWCVRHFAVRSLSFSIQREFVEQKWLDILNVFVCDSVNLFVERLHN